LGPAVVDRFDLLAAKVINIVVRASTCHHITNALFIYTVILLTPCRTASPADQPAIKGCKGSPA
jgi:hypothetical protein